ncbi:hypothetical protein GY45DRAFT_1297916 [Cubamyces sp. BRFM 1775]|nr:hypothetical protein GY45DRAFT_1297916 [Cubamyces sp. BRFM 1775]
MALTATVFLATFAVLDSMAVPLGADSTTDLSSTFSSQVSSAYSSTISSSAVVSGSAAVASITTTSSSPAGTALASSPSSLSASPTDSQAYTSATSFSSAAAESTATVVSTVYAAPPTVTVTGPPQTVTDTITIVPPPTPAPTVQQTAWSAPPQMTDLSAFNIQNFAYGSQNMRIIVGSPLQTNGTTTAGSSNSTADLSSETLSEAEVAVASAASAGLIPPPPVPTPDAAGNIDGNSTGASTGASFLQLFYPANSINPAQEPQGGADFYATPLDLSGAKNVSLEYSVFFPADFDFVQAGKLPGIYGGHDGCSGGDDALECFSTRLMWRSKGVGELYLYAPKDKQTDALCATPPQSVCDADWGLSIGRGSFNFTPGNWTHVRQTVTLNTPGKQDGGFALDVNGVRVIERCDVYYRGAPAESEADPQDESAVPVLGEGVSSVPGTLDQKGYIDGPFHLKVDSVLAATHPQAARDYTPMFAPYLPPADDPDTGSYTPEFAPPTSFEPVPDIKVAGPALSPSDDAGSGGSGESTAAAAATTVSTATTVTATPQTFTVYPTSTETAYAMAIETGVPPSSLAAEDASPSTPIGFTGLFFSTFFGGHEPKYATPKDQFTWFKDFAMNINA